MDQFCESLKRISDAWESIGGGPTAREIEAPVLYFSVRKVWMVEKARFANLVYIFEQLAEEERRYEDDALYFSKHTFEDLKVAKSCMEVLQVARKNCPYMVGGGDVDFVPGERFSRMKYWDKQALLSSRSSWTIRGDLSPCSPLTPPPMDEPLRPLPLLPETSSFSSPSSSISSEFRLSPPPSISYASIQDAKGPKMVTFAEDCVENEKRRSIYWHRNSPHYEPGRHACPSDNGYFDTSNLPSTEYDLESSTLRAKLRSIMKTFSFLSEDTSINNTDTSEDLDSDTDSSNSSVIAIVDHEIYGGSRQSYHLAEKLQEEYGDGGLPYDDEDEDFPILEDGQLNAIVSRGYFTSSVPDVDMLGNKKIAERAKAEEVKNMQRREKIESEMNVGKEMKMITSSLGHLSRVTYEPNLVDRDPAEAPEDGKFCLLSLLKFPCFLLLLDKILDVFSVLFSD
jgi:hypothetical protein